MSSSPNASEPTLGRLTVAVWILALLVSFNVGLSLFALNRASLGNTGKPDPIVGSWQWTKPTQHVHGILPDGSLLCGGKIEGSWKLVDSDKRLYVLRWRDRWTDSLTLSADGNMLAGTNNEGVVVEAKRVEGSGVSSPNRQGLPDVKPEDAIAESSVVAVLTYEQDGDRYKAVLSEVLKKAPDASFDYQVGDEIKERSFESKNGESRGDGMVMFLAGSPPNFRRGVSIFDDRIHAFDAMPMAVFRELVARTPVDADVPVASNYSSSVARDGSEDFVVPDLEAWDSVKKGLSVAELEKLLGPPIDGFRIDDDTRPNHIHRRNYGYVARKSQAFPGDFAFNVLIERGKVWSKEDPFGGVEISNDGLPTKPRLITPADGTLFNHYPRYVDLRWYASSGAYPMNYEIQVDTENRRGGGWFEENPERVNVPYFSYSHGGACGARWRVRGVNAKGAGPWSDYSYFQFSR